MRPVLSRGLRAMRCPNCGSSSVVQDDVEGVVVCASCGLVLTDLVVDPGPEWRVFEREGRERTRAPCDRLPGRGLGAGMPFVRCKDAEDPHSYSELKRLESLSRRVLPRAERSVVEACSLMEKMAEEFRLPEHVKETASALIRRAFKAKELPMNHELLAIVCLYVACRMHRIPVTLDEMVKRHYEEDEDELIASLLVPEEPRTKRVAEPIKKAHRYLKHLREVGVVGRLPPIGPKAFVERAVLRLGLPGEVHDEALRILGEVKARKLHLGKKPSTIAGAVVYCACKRLGYEATQVEIAGALGITTVAIRKYSRMIEKELGS